MLNSLLGLRKPNLVKHILVSLAVLKPFNTTDFISPLLEMYHLTLLALLKIREPSQLFLLNLFHSKTTIIKQIVFLSF